MEIQVLFYVRPRAGELPERRLVAYVVSTTGQGEEPDNMRRSWRFLLRRSLPPSSLHLQHFGVLGLGDSSYPR
jgi:sulfite reductase alpha subunit-like flavoprotein